MTVLALEFRAVRDTADFSFLAKDFPLHRVDPISAHSAAPLTVRQQAKELASRRLHLVLAYCSCAALGAHVAELSGARLILIDADAVTPEAVRRDVVTLCKSLGTAPTKNPDTAFAVVRDDLAAAQGADVQAYEIVDELLNRYRAWLRFLAAAAAADPATPTGEIITITSKPLPVLGKLLTAPDRAQVHRISSQFDTLELPEVRAFLQDQLANGAEE